MSQEKDEWEEMVEKAFETKGQTDDNENEQHQSDKSIDIEDGEYVSSSEEESLSLSTSSCESDDWAPRKPRVPPLIPEIAGKERENEPSDAEEAVRAAGIGMESLSLGPTVASSFLPSSQKSIEKKTSVEQVPPLLPNHYEKLKSISRRITANEPLFGMVTPISLCPFAKDFDAPVQHRALSPFEIPMNLSFINPNLESKPVNSTDFDILMPFSSLLAIVGSNILTNFKQSWCIPFTINEEKLIFREPAHDAPISRVFAYFKLLSHSFSSQNSLNHCVEINSKKVLIQNFVPILFSFPGCSSLLDSLIPFYPLNSEIYNIDLFSLSVRAKSSHTASPNRYANAVSILHHLFSSIYTELAQGEYLLVHRSDEAVCYVCTKEKINEQVQLDINVAEEMPSEMSLQLLNE
jgi:hypothetical protein